MPLRNALMPDALPLIPSSWQWFESCLRHPVERFGNCLPKLWFFCVLFCETLLTVWDWWWRKNDPKWVFPTLGDMICPRAHKRLKSGFLAREMVKVINFCFGPFGGLVCRGTSWFIGMYMFLWTTVTLHPKSQIPEKNTAFTRSFFRKVRANFSLLSCDASEERNRNCSETLIQANFFILGGFFQIDFLLWISGLLQHLMTLWQWPQTFCFVVCGLFSLWGFYSSAREGGRRSLGKACFCLLTAVPEVPS